MTFSKYRSKAIRIMWRKFWKQYPDITERNMVRKPRFSTWQIDDICAVSWKHEVSLDVCGNVLFDYLKELIK